jgi:hypothetical protein
MLSGRENDISAIVPIHLLREERGMSVIVFTVGGFTGSFALIAMNRATIRNRSSSSSTSGLLK